MTDVLIATDAPYVLDEVQAALEGPDVTFRVTRWGKLVVPACRLHAPDLVVLDLQIGNMGGIACTLSLRLEESAGRLPHLPVMLLLDRTADVFMARRSEADGFLLKPLDAFRLRRASEALLAGDTFMEGLPSDEGSPIGAQ